jgi:hypothetical protein
MGTVSSLLLLLTLLQSSEPQACTWGSAKEVGTLASEVNESSGMAISRRIPNRTYRINDSGDSGRFFAMDVSGRGARIVNISGFNPIDTEDMAIGPCSESSDCIFIGDIGDNDRNRKDIELVVVEERPDFPSEVRAAYRVRMKYPDGPHDAEALAVHPDGSVYIVTKEVAKSEIFRLKREQWSNPQSGVASLELVAVLDWAALRPSTLAFTRMVTAMDIAPDGKKFLLLNYSDAMEFFVDLSAGKPDPRTWREDLDYRTIRLTTLEQEEAIAYLPDGRGLLYDTERVTETRPARIMRMDCR